MREEWLEVSVTFDERHGYVASAPELRARHVRSLTNGLPSRTNVCSRRKCNPVISWSNLLCCTTQLFVQMW